MSVCSIKWCGKSSRTSNVTKDGITFHRFPRDPEFLSKWTEATRRGENWAPKPVSVVCSRHFTKDCFIVDSRKRRLFKDALPTLNLPVMTSQAVDACTQTVETVPNEIKRIHQDIPSPSDDFLAQRLYRKVVNQSATINTKVKKIKQLRDSLRRAQAKIKKLETVLNELKRQGVIPEINTKSNSKKKSIKQSDFTELNIAVERKSIHIIKL